MEHSRRDFLKLLSLFSLAGSAGALSAQPLQNIAQNSPLKIGYLPIADATPLLVAHAQKFFEKHSVETEKPIMFRSWAQLVEAFLSGNVNIVHLLSPMAIWAKYGAGANINVVMWNHLAGSALTVQLEINHIRELSGKTVAIPFWYSIHNVVLQHLLRANGLTVTENKSPQTGEVRIVVLPPSDMVTALANRAISGFIVAEPFNVLAEQKGVGKVLRFSADVWRDHACCLTLMHQHDLQQRPEWTQKVVNALTEAQVFCLQHQDKVAPLLARENGYTPHTQKVLESVFSPNKQQWENYLQTGAIKHPEWHINASGNPQRIGFQPYPFDSYLETLTEQIKKTHIAGNNHFLTALDPVTVARELNAPQFVRRAIEQHQWQSLFGLEAWQRTEQIEV